MKTLASLVLVATSMSACEWLSPQEKFPTYGGKYELEEVKMAEIFSENPEVQTEILVKLPGTLEVYQYPFRRRAGVNHHDFAVFSTDPIAPGVMVHTPSMDYPLSLLHLGKWTDTTSPYLGIDVGYACQWYYSAHFDKKFSPDAGVLNEAYPACEIVQGDREELCLLPNDWTELPVKDIGWGEENPVRLTFTLRVSKYISGTGYQTACGKPDQEGTIQLTYRRTEAMDMGDPRIESFIHETTINQRLENEGSALDRIFALPRSHDEANRIFDAHE